MSNLKNANRSSLQTSMTNKSKSQTSANDLHERKTKALEGGLHKLKVTTPRGEPKPSIEANHHRLNTEASSYASHPKSSGRLVSTKSLTTQAISNCGQCEKDGAEMQCLECGENYCANCYEHFHTRGALQRHHYILLSRNSSPTSPKKTQSRSADIDPPVLLHREQYDDMHRRYVTTFTKHKSDELTNEKINLPSSRLSFPHQDSNRSKRIPSKSEIITSITEPIGDAIESSNKLPIIELKKSSNNKLFTKTYRIVDKNSEAVYVHRSRGTTNTKQQPPKVIAKTNVRHSFPDRTNVRRSRTDNQRLDHDLSRKPIAESVQARTVEEKWNTLEQDEDQERPITHVSTKSRSRSASPSIRRSVLPTQFNDEKKATNKSTLNLSRSSSTVEKSNQVSNPNRRPKHSEDIQSDIIDQYSMARFSSALDDIVDRSKLELVNHLNRLSDHHSPSISETDHSFPHVVPLNSVTITSRRNSPFSFSHSLIKATRINSASSLNTGDGGFFTDFLPQEVIPLPILECSASNEWNQSIERHQTSSSSVSSRQPSRECSTRATSHHSIALDETNDRSKSSIENPSRRGSSLLSSSLSIAIASSELDSDQIDPQMEPLATSSRKPSSTAQKSVSSTPVRKSSTSTIKISSPIVRSESPSLSAASPEVSSPTPSIPIQSASSRSTPMSTAIRPSAFSSATSVAEHERVVLPCRRPECLEESMNTIEKKNSSAVHISPSLNDTSKLNSKPALIRGEKIIVNKMTAKKKTGPRRHISTRDGSSERRRLEFSLGDGLKWQEASVESISLTKTICSDRSPSITIPQSSNPMHTQFAEDTSISDNDDDRPSRTSRNVNDSNQLRSELNMMNSDEHVLTTRENAQLSLNKNDSVIFQTQLPDGETSDRLSSDNESSMCE